MIVVMVAYPIWFDIQIIEMLTSEISFKQTKNLNLLLKQQIIKQIEEEDGSEDDTNMGGNSNNTQSQSYEREVSVKETTMKFYLNRKLSPVNDETKMELASIELEESAASSETESLCQNFDLLETLLDQTMQHLDCMILELKSSNRLANILNIYVVHENRANQQLEKSLKHFGDKPDLDTLDDIKTKLFVSLNRYEHLKPYRTKYEQKKNDHQLAFKNFKIILEVMNVNESSLGRLRQQYDEILMECRRCRGVLNREMPFILAERTEMLAECLKLLGNECENLRETRTAMSNIFQELGSNIDCGEYVLVEKELFGSK